MATRPNAPKRGQLVQDKLTGAVGEYMGTAGGRVYLRPVGGGTEWETFASEIEPAAASPAEVGKRRPADRPAA